MKSATFEIPFHLKPVQPATPPAASPSTDEQRELIEAVWMLAHLVGDQAEQISALRDRVTKLEVGRQVQ